MHKRNLASLYSWAKSIPSSSNEKRPSKRAKDSSSSQKIVQEFPAEDQEMAKPHNGEQEDDWDIPSDTVVALKMMRAQFPKLDKVLVPPFVLRSQLYSSVKDHTLVDRELEVLKQKTSIRLFKFSTGQDDYGILLSEDYVEQIRASKKRMERKHSENDLVVFDWFTSHVLPNHVDVGIAQCDLEFLLSNGGCVQENHISLLIKAGLLVRQLADATSYWFAIPNVGYLLNFITQGRKELLSFLKRRKHKEILLSALEKRKLSKSKLDVRFHLRDLLGSGHLCLAHSAAGLLVQVSKV